MQHLPMFGHTRNRTLAQGGFTLIELSIVLVIIALVVGGVFQGTELIRTAEIRSFLSQLDKYRIAVSNFERKYDVLPGDMPPAGATKWGFVSRSGYGGHGDANNMVESYYPWNGLTAPVWTTIINGEIPLFWNDLSTSGFITGNYAGTDCAGTSPACTAEAATTILPQATIGFTTVVSIYGDSNVGNNYFLTMSGTTRDATGWLSGGQTYALTPMQAFAIDSKADDGTPLGGNINALGALNAYAMPSLASPAAAASGVCVTNATGNPYNTSASTGGNNVGCTLRIRMQ